MEASEAVLPVTNEAESQESAPAEAEQTQEESSSPDLSEQIANLEAKIDARFPQEPAEETDEEGPSDDVWSGLYGDEEEYDEEGEYEDEEQYGAPQQQQQQPDGSLDPAVQQAILQAVAPELERIRGAVGYMAEEYRRGQINSLAEANPDLKRPDVQKAVASHLKNIAVATGSDVGLDDPRVVEIALRAVQAQRAQQAAPAPAEQEAPIETNASASVEGGVDSDEQWRNEILQAGGSAFPS